MNINHKIAIVLAVIALPLIAAAAMYTPTTSSNMVETLAENALVIDFSVYPESKHIVVERGKAAQIPLKVEAPRDAEKTLQVRITYDRGNADPEKLQAALSKSTLTLSKLDIHAGESALGAMPVRDAGILTLTPMLTMSPGIYTLGIEAEQQIDSDIADKLVSGRVITVEVK